MPLPAAGGPAITSLREERGLFVIGTCQDTDTDIDIVCTCIQMYMYYVEICMYIYMIIYRYIDLLFFPCCHFVNIILVIVVEYSILDVSESEVALHGNALDASKCTRHSGCFFWRHLAVVALQRVFFHLQSWVQDQIHLAGEASKTSPLGSMVA